MHYQGRLSSYGWVAWLLLLLLSFCSQASETRFHHFYFSEEHGVPVYLTGLLSATALHGFQQKVPGFQSRREKLNDHERLLLISTPDTDRQNTSFQPTGIRLYPAGVCEAMPCSLLSPLEIPFADFSRHSVTAYKLWNLPGPVNTRCSHFQYSGTSEVSYFRDLPLAASGALPFPDGTTIVEVPAVEKNTQGSAISGAGGTGLNPLMGRGGGFGSWFDFRPGGGGGGGYSNLLDISVMLALLPVTDNSSDAATGDFEEMIVVSIVDGASREWQHTYTKDEARQLLADIDDGDELISRIQKLKIAVSAEIIGDLSPVCRESVQKLSQVLAMAYEHNGQTIPGVIHLDGGKKDASTQTQPASGQQGSGSSGQATSHLLGATQSGISGSAGGGDGNDEKESPPKKLLSPCETSDSDQAAAVQKERYFYSFRYLGKDYELEVQFAGESINYLICAICCNLCHQASTYCGDHFDCNQCLQNELKAVRPKKPKCARCLNNKGQGIMTISGIDKFSINPLPVSCPGRENGCSETPCIKDLKSHCSTCPYVEVKCPIDGCDAQVLRCKLPVHKDECEYQIVPCTNNPDGCSVETMRKNMREHLAVCEYAIINCPTPGCPEMVYRYSVNTHQGECDFVIVSCDNVFKGEKCQVQCMRGELELHKKTVCPYQKIPCPDCYEDIRRQELTPHRQICEYRQIQCGLCNQPTIYRQLLRHQMSCTGDAHSQNQENTFSQCTVVYAQALAREDELLERIERLEEQLKPGAEKNEQLVHTLTEQLEKSQQAEKQRGTLLEVFTQKNQELERTLARFQLNINFADFQLHGFVGDQVLRAFKGEDEMNRNHAYCIIPKDKLKSFLQQYYHPDIMFDLNVSGTHILLRIVRLGHGMETEINAKVKLLPTSNFDLLANFKSRLISVGLLDRQGRACNQRNYHLEPCAMNHNHGSVELGWSCYIPLMSSDSEQNYLHNEHLIIFLKLED